MKTSKKFIIIKNTLILTIAGIIARIMGFFYRIYLSKIIGAEGLGIYQLVYPIFLICITLCSSGIQSGMCRMSAASLATGNTKKVIKTFKMSFIITLVLSGFTSIALWIFSSYIGSNFLCDARSILCLKIFAFAIPFTCISCLTSGLFYGINAAHIPAISQLIEQMVRIASVYILIPVVAIYTNTPNNLHIVVWGIVISEAASALVGIIGYILVRKSKISPAQSVPSFKKISYMKIWKEMFSTAAPITVNRVSVTLLATIESTLIPTQLIASGLSTSEALSIYGTLVGMAVPFIIFPNAFTNSLSVLLMPHVAEANAVNSNNSIKRTAEYTIRFCLLTGILATFIFSTYGNEMALSIFNSHLAGEFIVTLAWLCPFMYLSSTLVSILNGLNKVNKTLMISLVGTSITIASVLLFIIPYGIKGYLYGVLLSSILTCLLHLYFALKETHATVNLLHFIIIPIIIGFISTHLTTWILPASHISIIHMLFSISVMSVIYFALIGFVTFIKSKIII